MNLIKFYYGKILFALELILHGFFGGKFKSFFFRLTVNFFFPINNRYNITVKIMKLKKKNCGKHIELEENKKIEGNLKLKACFHL